MTPPPRPLPDLPLTFREELTPHVYRALNRGASVALVGVAGGGLSNALRFMAQPAVAAHYLGERAGDALLVLVEADLWGEPAAVYRELAHTLAAAAHAQQWPRAEQAALRTVGEAALTSQAAQGGTLLAEALEHLCGGRRKRVVFFCDEFDSALAHLPAEALRVLRGLRDAHEGRLCFVAGLHREPGLIAAARPAAPDGPDPLRFVELFEQHTFAVRPYAPGDARVAMAYRTADWQPPLEAETAETLYRVSGGHARLLTTCLNYLSSHRQLAWAQIEPGLLGDPANLAPCSAIWNDLDAGEQRAAWLLAREARAELDEAQLARLQLRGLAVGGPPFLFSSLFEAFVSTLPEPPAPEPNRVPLRLRDPAASKRGFAPGADP
ncbi:MAG: hypothetical protein IT317_04410 [Anaerolineales bacterium]|nr:hypothetical protein [Anaerolineales bacterium]